MLKHTREKTPMDELPLWARTETIEEQVRRKEIKPVTNLADMACDVFESDEEMADFIAYTYECRRRDLA